jgi:hypothetical protein
VSRSVRPTTTHTRSGTSQTTRRIKTIYTEHYCSYLVHPIRRTIHTHLISLPRYKMS